MEKNRSIDISIIIPTYNRPEQLRRCILSFVDQGYPKDSYEIIVADDGSSCDIPCMIKDLQKKCGNLKYIQQYHKGPAAARNRGVEASSGKIIGFVDDDCAAEKGWIKLMVEAHKKDSHIAAVGGLTSTSSRKTPVLVSQFLSNCSIETYINNGREVIFFPTCNVSLKREIFDRYKFNEEFPLPGGEDLEFFWKLFKSGHRFIWDRNIKVMHYRDDTLRGFIKQAYIYGRGNLLVQHMHRDHPLLKELKTDRVSFWWATMINTIKIPRFSYLLGRRLIQENHIGDNHKQLSVYSYFVLHKIFYLFGNIFEFIGL